MSPHILLAQSHTEDHRAIFDALRARFPTITLSTTASSAYVLWVAEHRAADLVIVTKPLDALSTLQLIDAIRMRNPAIPVILSTSELHVTRTALAFGADGVVLAGAFCDLVDTVATLLG